MAVLSKLVVALGLDASDYQTGLDSAEKKAGTSAAAIGGKLESIGKSMMKTGAVMSAAITAPLTALGMKSLDAASDLEESMNKVGVVFGDAAAYVEGFSSTAATALGMSQQAALEATGTFGNLFTSMGMGQYEAADLSTSIVTLASDLASFNNIDPAEALEKLRAGLIGETEPLRSLGIQLSADAVKAKALEMGMINMVVSESKVADATAGVTKAQIALNKAMESGDQDKITIATLNLEKAERKLADAQEGSAGKLTAEQKAIATYRLILEQTTNAQGDFARTSDGLANSQRILKAQLADTAATIGTQLLPYGLQAVQFANDLIGKFQALSPEVQKGIVVVGGLAAALGPVIMVAGSLVTAIGGITTAIGAVSGAIAGVIGIGLGPLLLIIGAIVGAVLLFKAAWDNNFLGIRDTLTAVWENNLKPAFEAVKGFLEVFIPQAIQVLTDAWNLILLPVLNAVWSFIQTYLSPLFDVLARIVLVAVGKALDVLAGIWNNVIYPALILVWETLKQKLQPGLDAISAIVRDVLGPVLQWLGENILARVEAGFDAIGKAIEWVTGMLEAFAAWLASIEIPAWLQGHSPPPLANWLTAIGEAAEELARVQLPELEVALKIQAPPLPALSGGIVGGGGGGDTFIIHNHNPLAAALTNAMVEDRRRARLNRSM